MAESNRTTIRRRYRWRYLGAGLYLRELRLDTSVLLVNGCVTVGNAFGGRVLRGCSPALLGLE
ncbi:MAG: hypothetical protein ACOZHQ_09560 [Thermodesulfobacteriota bacterium]